MNIISSTLRKTAQQYWLWLSRPQIIAGAWAECYSEATCAHTSSLPELGGEAVLYFEPDDVEAMAKQIGRLLKDEPLRQRLEQAGLIQARQFSWPKTALATLNVYRHVSHY